MQGTSQVEKAADPAVQDSDELERSNKEVDNRDASQVGMGEERENGRGDAGRWSQQGMARGKEVLDDAGAVAEEGEVDFQHGLCGSGCSEWMVEYLGKEKERKNGAGSEVAPSGGDE